MRKYNIPIFVSHKGCPNACVFCNQKRITSHDGDVDGVLAQKIIEDSLRSMKEEERSVEVAYFGGSFTAICPSRMTELLEAAHKFILSGEADGIRISTRPDCIDEAILDTLKKYGVTSIELGAQSMDDEVLMLCKRGHTSGDVKRASKLISDYGFELGLQMMTGLPGDTVEKSIRTAEEIIKLAPKTTRIYPTLVIRDTELCDMYEKGEYKPQSLDDAVKLTAKLYAMFSDNNITVLRMGLMASEDMQQGKNIAAGPFHPSFGELVHSELFYEKMERIIESKNSPESITLYVNPSYLSKALGNKRSNIIRIKEKYGMDVSIKPLKTVESGGILC